jgi:prolyl oligopeptidase
VLKRPSVRFDPDAYVVEQVFYDSKDGTRVPMFIVQRVGLMRDGTHPTLLYGYGGFNISLTPAFSPAIVAWLEMGGTFAVANVRGGGEYGKAWHEAGRLDRKQNAFDDFIAAAEYLIREGYTSRDTLAINGASNGGLLVAAAMIQRPDLFAAVVPQVGVLDMLRFHKFTIGWAWTSDYGCADEPAGFANLVAYSPLHNIVPGTTYPASLIVTGDHDDRVVPAHSYKFAAALQAAQGGTAPILARIDIRAGHGAGKPTTKQIDERADMHAFLWHELHTRREGR